MQNSTIPAQDVIDYVLRQVGDESGVQFTDQDIIRWINAGQRDIIYTNQELNQVEAAINVVSGLTRYPVLDSLPDVMKIHSLELNGEFIRNYSLEDVQSGKIPDGAYWWVFGGVINIRPEPTEDKSEGMILRYTKAPSRVAQGLDILTIPDDYFKALVDYCLKEAYELDENFEASNLKGGQLDKFLQDRALSSVIDTSRDYPSIRDWDE